MYKFQNVCHHHRHYCLVEVTVMLTSFESQVLSELNFVNAGDWKLFPITFMILMK